MTETRLTGIYLSTSAVHVAVYDLNGEVLATGKAPVSDDTTVAWERALREAAPSLPANSICSVASTSGTAVLVDEYGEPVFQPVMYHESTPGLADHLREQLPDVSVQGWDIALSPTAPIPKILRLREAHPERFDNVEWILSPTTWLLYRLLYDSSSRWRNVETDWTNALKFGADITTPVPEWFDELIAGVDLPKSLFPSIRPPGSFIGVSESELAQRTGFDGMRLSQGMTDGSAFVLASGCFEPGDFSLTFGGTSVVKYVSEKISPHEALYYHRHPIEGYLPGAAFDTGDALRWFFDRVLNMTTDRGLELAAQTPAGEEYETFLPGNRSPFFDPSVSGSILGIDYDRSLSTEQVHGRMARGLTSGIVLAEKAYLDIIEDHFDTTIDRIRLMNDDAPSPDDDYNWWNTLRASVWDREVVEMEPRTIAGLLIPAALINSTYQSKDEAREKLLRQREVVTSDPEINDNYKTGTATYLDRWREIASLYGGP